MGATSVIQFETEKDRDAQAIFERSLQVNKVSGKQKLLVGRETRRGLINAKPARRVHMQRCKAVQ